ncbi:TTK family protein kinase [Heterostelium album PN500]|uniref:TTK family protein kinase n=1 Tax=Heterostelium pallidum (strain ATCC 26659 / Pp 5 / PN500) TaxID=670386 RepID=D3BHB8_HETP5|nr:TTK family protein kinase [Heterostelium album PN500]EFA79095.1 TTK family protein kinase [Heterostelium album PN500]|eukprot:XP_020431217.1 TTK family protein kinase [Heterostelium album PN500]
MQHQKQSNSTSGVDTLKTPMIKMPKQETTLSPITMAMREGDATQQNTTDPSWWAPIFLHELDAFNTKNPDTQKPNPDDVARLLYIFQRSHQMINHKEHENNPDLENIYSAYAGFQLRINEIEDAREILKFMKVHHIGLKRADFYTKLAYIEMLNKHFEKSRAKIQEGIDKDAQPLSDLHAFFTHIDKAEEKHLNKQQLRQSGAMTSPISPVVSDHTTPTPSPGTVDTATTPTSSPPISASSLHNNINNNSNMNININRVSGSVTLPESTNVPDLINQQQQHNNHQQQQQQQHYENVNKARLSTSSITANSISSGKSFSRTFRPLGLASRSQPIRVKVSGNGEDEETIEEKEKIDHEPLNTDDQMSDDSTPSNPLSPSNVTDPLNDLNISNESEQMDAESSPSNSPQSNYQQQQQQQQPAQPTFKPQPIRHPIHSIPKIQQIPKRNIAPKPTAPTPTPTTPTHNVTAIHQPMNQQPNNNHQNNNKQNHNNNHHNQNNNSNIDNEVIDPSRTFEIAKSWSETTIVNGKSYLKIEFIGKGGSGKVYKVLSQDLKIYALKYVCLKSGDNDIESQLNEIEMLKKLNRFDNIIKLIDNEVDLNQGHILLVLELGDIDLARLLHRHQLTSNVKGINENLLRIYWQQMLHSVHTIHEERIIHGDLKPANFVSVQGNLKLIDFGIAKAIQNDTTNIVRDSHVGTLNYISPEALIDTGGNDNSPKMKLGRASDIWSLGCILYEMTYGYSPFKQFTNLLTKYQAIVNPKHQITYPPHRNAALLDVLKRCLQRDPLARPTIPKLLEHPFLNS